MISEAKLGSMDNPVKCKGVEGEHRYLNRLFSPDGLPITYVRLGSRKGNNSSILDLYEINYEGLSEPIMIFMDMYAKGPAEKKAVEGLHTIDEFKKPKSWQTANYCNDIIEKYLPDDADTISYEFFYLHSKAGFLLSMGPYIYAKLDFFNFPDLEWNLAGIKQCTEALVHFAKGAVKNHPIEVDDHETAINFLQTFHFEADDKKIDARDFSVEATHMMNGRKITLYFRLTS
jgi:hypothetical protein